MIGLRPLLLRTAAAIGEGGLDDVAAFWAAVEWNAYLRRGNMLSVCVGGEPMEMLTDGKMGRYNATHRHERGVFHVPPGETRFNIHNAGSKPLTVIPPATETMRALPIAISETAESAAEHPRYIHRVYGTGYVTLPDGTELPASSMEQIKEIFDRHARESSQQITDAPSCSVLNP